MNDPTHLHFVIVLIAAKIDKIFDIANKRIKIFNKIDKPQKNKTNLSEKTQVTVS